MVCKLTTFVPNIIHYATVSDFFVQLAYYYIETKVELIGPCFNLVRDKKDWLTMGHRRAMVMLWCVSCLPLPLMDSHSGMDPGMEAHFSFD